jgi:DNA-binding NarL/FixJ family response regulator
LTTFDLDDYVSAALRAGASGFLLKDTPPADLHAAIRIVASGDALLAPRVTRRLIAKFAAVTETSAETTTPTQTATPTPAGAPRGTTTSLTTPPAAEPLLSALTDREREVLALVAEGLTNAEIGERLYITAGTARTHVARLLHKLGARDRVQLVILAYRNGLTSRSA